MRYALRLLACCSLFLTACASEHFSSPSSSSSSSLGSATADDKLSGVVHGGQQPIAGAHIYLYAVSTSGYGSASTSLLQAGPDTLQDSNGVYYTTTNYNGNFNITSADRSCTSSQPAYLYSLGGNPGVFNAANSGAGLMALLGPWANFSSLPTAINMNEVTTVAAAYALAAFATDATHISASSSAQASIGLANTVGTANNLAMLSTGAAPANSQGGNATVPVAEINTLAGILSACINSTDPAVAAPSGACSTLFGTATSDGTSSGSHPTDTASAAINIAQHPGSNVGALFGLVTPAAPFQSVLSTAPNDWTIALTYTGGSLHGPLGLAVDSSGYVWVANSAANCISQFQPNGVPGAEDGYSGNGVEPATCGTGTSGAFNSPSYIAFSPSGNIWLANYSSVTELDFSNGLGYESFLNYTGNYTGGNVNGASGIAFDKNGNAWIANGGYNANSITEFVGSSGTSYSGGGLNSSAGIAIDTSNHVWIGNNNANDISEFNIGTSSFVGSGYAGGQAADAVAIDSGGNVWVANRLYASVSKLNSSGSVQIYYANGGGISYPTGIAIDGANHIWTANQTNNTVSEFDSNGNALTPSSGFKGGLSGPNQLAIDPSGNLWVTDYNNGSGNSLTEFIGVAAPVVTPLSVALKNGQVATRP
jgi:streptogramin lyase